MASVNKVLLSRLYITERKSIPDIAVLLGMSYYAARQALLRTGVALRSRADGVRAARPKLGSGLRGKKRSFTEAHRSNIAAARRAAPARGVSRKPNGYLEFTRGEHKGRAVHVVVMERALGRALDQDEVVHHIDRDRSNNEISNLQVMTRSAHMSLHRREGR